jgi:hypothetical protein
MSLQNKLGNTQSRVNIVIAVTGRLVNDITISFTARLHINTVRTEETDS